MSEHVGKKRRKEVRQAIDLKHEMHKSMAFVAALYGVTILLLLIFMMLTIYGIVGGDSIYIQWLPLAVVFIVLFISSSRILKWSNLRAQYKQHCKKYNISKKEMQALDHGEL